MKSFAPSQRSRRGVAMLLVIVCVATVTVLTTAYLASRDNSAQIGQNVSEATAARFAADSGVALGIAALQTEVDWRQHASSTAGTLFNFPNLGNAQLSVRVTDMLTNAPPTSDSEYLEVDVTADVNGVTQSSSALVYVPLEPGTVADIDLSEFAVFANTLFTMSDRAMLMRWPSSPLSKLGKRVAVSTRGTAASSVSFGNTTSPSDVTVFTAPGASGALVSNSSRFAVASQPLPEQIPIPMPPNCGEVFSLLTLNDNVLSAANNTISSNYRCRTFEIKNSAVQTLQGNITCVIDGNCLINTAGKVVIDGNVKIVVFGDLNIDAGAIELTPTSRLRMYVRGTGARNAVIVKNGYIGDTRAVQALDVSGDAGYFDPQRIALFSMSPLAGLVEWRVELGSVIKGTIYIPQAKKITLTDTSALYGRVVAPIVAMNLDAAIFYDTILNSRCGYTNPKSGIYENDGTVKSTLRTLASLDPLVLQLTADTTVVKISSNLGSKTTYLPASMPPEPSKNTPPGEPTPRTIEVEYDLISFGADIESWE